MKRSLVICGSAGRGGVTESMCRAAVSSLRDRGQDAIAVFPSDMRILHCTGCGRCRDGPCVLDDDMQVLYRLFSESDFLVLATPLHFNGPSSLMKTVMDRFQGFWYDVSRPHPLAAMGMLCAGSAEPNFSPALSIMRAFSVTVGTEWIGHLEFPDTDRRGDEGVGEAVDSFIDGILAEARRKSMGDIWPPCSTGSG